MISRKMSEGQAATKSAAAPKKQVMGRRSQNRRFFDCLVISILALLSHSEFADAFVVMPTTQRTAPSWPLFALPEIDTMKAGEMRKELESYGISTKSMFEKSEFSAALEKARKEGKKPVNGSSEAGKGFSSKSKKAADTSKETTESREERYAKALETAKSMKLGDLRKELTSRGISTKSFFEKSEFVKAYAEAVADNTKGEEPFDPDYRDVVMQKIDVRALAGQSVIEIQLS